MERFLVLERGEGIRRAVRAGLSAWGGPRAGGGPALLVLSPRAAGSGPLRLPPCRAVLLPGEGGAELGALRAASAVSYGLSPRDSLTLSSREGGRLWCALQRELVTLDGAVVERQEFPLVPPPGLEPLPALAAAGALLILGAPPGALWAPEEHSALIDKRGGAC